MARRKRGTTGSAENKSVYNPTKQQLKKLQSEIKNYNRRLQSAIKRTSPELREYLPPKLSYTEEAGKIKSAKGFKRRIETLQRFDRAGLELTTFEGRPIAKASLDLIRRSVAEENRRRKKRVATQAEAQERLGRFPTQPVYGTRPVTLSKIIADEEERQRLETEFLEPENANPLTEAYRQNYIRHAYEALQLWNVSNGENDEVTNLVMQIIGVVASASKEVIDASIGIPETRIDILSDLELFINNLAYILGIWESL